MPGFLYNAGKKSGPLLRKGQWVWRSLTGSEAEAIEAEHKVGKDVVAALTNAEEGMTVDADPQGPAIDQRDFVQQMGAALAARVMNKHYVFTFAISEGGEPNAFALPGGFIFISRSLLEMCRWDRDEIAFVLAHEIGHVVKGHAIERMMNTGLINAASRALPAAGAVVAWVKRVGIKALHSAYSQDNEFEADAFGLKLVSATGLDPQGAVRMLERLQAISSDPQGLGEYFATHPPTADRIMAIRKRIG